MTLCGAGKGMKTAGDYRRRKMGPWQWAQGIIVESRRDWRLCSDAGIAEGVCLKAELLVSLSHLVWTVHISPRLALTCRFFSISTLAWAPVTLINCSYPPHTFHAFCLPSVSHLVPKPVFFALISDRSPAHSIPAQGICAVSGALPQKPTTWHSRLSVVLSYLTHWIIFR